MKLARILWISGSSLIFVLLTGYILILDPPAESGPARLEYILDHWGLYSFMFRTEFLMGVTIGISALILAQRFKNGWLVLVGIGMLLYALPFPIVLGLYPVASTEVSVGFSTSAHLLVDSGLMISMGGFLGLHATTRILPKWLHMAALILAIPPFSMFTLAFLGLADPVAAQKSMILVALLFAINIYYGWRLKEMND